MRIGIPRISGWKPLFSFGCFSTLFITLALAVSVPQAVSQEDEDRNFFSSEGKFSCSGYGSARFSERLGESDREPFEKIWSFAARIYNTLGQRPHRRWKGAEIPGPRIHFEDDFFVLEVIVEEGSNHSIYWIGVDLRSGPMVADFYRVSSDAQPYYRCNRWLQVEGAAAYRLIPGESFRAQLDIEPEHIVSFDESNLDTVVTVVEDEESDSPRKRCTIELFWDRAKGFTASEKPVRCSDAGPLLISISDDGQIAAREPASAGSRQYEEEDNTE